MVHNVELRAGRGGQLGRSAGAAIQLMAKEGDYALLKLPSGELRRVRIGCRATIGQVGNLEHENISFGKAGRIRWLGRRPHVRGIAMNPVDHPHGGGEGALEGQSSAVAVGPADQGLQDAAQQAHRPLDRAAAEAEEGLIVARSVKKGPVRRRAPREEGAGDGPRRARSGS